uniref:Glycosyl transferase family 1 domain-containing protein n=1 Tax=Aegilops tauschii subsp. strangulata TaxID=200361 RepID=A0A453BR66_AEGTS
MTSWTTRRSPRPLRRPTRGPAASRSSSSPPPSPTSPATRTASRTSSSTSARWATRSSSSPPTRACPTSSTAPSSSDPGASLAPGIRRSRSRSPSAPESLEKSLGSSPTLSTPLPLESWVFGALIIAKLLCVPLVMSYHTHVPIYIPRYTFSWLVKPMWLVIKFLHRAADLTLVPSVAIGRDLQAARVTAANKIRLWNKGVDSESFHPRFRSQEMRSRLTNGEPDKPLIIYVGRLGVEKSLDFHKRVMDRLPGSRIAFIGDGPFRPELEEMFSGMPAVFTGTLQGEELSQAYASGDVFVMPSESETLGFVVLEAMSSGVPVVAARAGGIPDIIPEDQEGKTSFLYIPGDVDDCVGKVELLLSCEELRETMGKAARKEMEKFGWKAATRKIRNEQYTAAIWFWRKKRSQLLRPLQWVFRRLFRPAPAPAPAITNQS